MELGCCVLCAQVCLSTFHKRRHTGDGTQKVEKFGSLAMEQPFVFSSFSFFRCQRMSTQTNSLVNPDDLEGEREREGS